MRRRVRSAVPYTPALSALSILFLGAPTSNQPAPVSLPSSGSRALAPSGPSCPLPVGKQVQAVKAFRKMMPVFRHPRCLNCHGGFDITSEQHQGSDVATKTGLNPRALLTIKERQKLHAGCGGCHDNVQGTLTRRDGTQMTGWLVAPQPMLWDGKDDEELCMQMKRFEGTGDQFVDHLETDHREIRFIEAAFHGDRALGDLLDAFDLKVDSPPGTQMELVEKARKWVKLVGDGYTASPQCGCVMPNIKLKVHHTWLSEVPGGLPSRQASEARFEVNLRPVGDERPGYYQGQFSLDRPITMTLPRFCTGRASVKERWLLNALIDPESGSVRVWHTQLDDEPTGQIECKQGGGTARMLIDPGVLAGVLGAGELVIPADSTSKKVEASHLGTKESLTITVLEVPATQ